MKSNIKNKIVIIIGVCGERGHGGYPLCLLNFRHAGREYQIQGCKKCAEAIKEKLIQGN